MRISFDLDDTLFVSEKKFKTEKAPRFPFNLLYKEQLRQGTVGLMKRLCAEGVEVWIYTTSFRSERYIRGLFALYGIRPDAVVNGERHAREVQRTRKDAMPSKYPSRYKIDLHIDDDVSVLQNGRTYGFRVLIVGEQDDEWADKIWNEVEKIRGMKERTDNVHQTGGSA